MVRLLGVVCLGLGVAIAGPATARGGNALDDLNVRLAAEGAPVRVQMMEAIGADGVGLTVYAKNVGNKQLAAHFVKGDPERDGRTDITWIVDLSEGAPTDGPSLTETTAAIARAMQTWQDVNCSYLPLTDLGGVDFDLGYVQYLLEFGGVAGWAADLTHAGWLPAAFFDAVAPDGSKYILGATFTFIWTDEVTGEPTDMDRNHKNDVAFREIYYNDAFGWAIDPARTDDETDVESIAVHEAGHGLSQAHFGQISIAEGAHSRNLVLAPYAVMNAGYIGGTNQTLTGTDLGGHCSIWASW